MHLMMVRLERDWQQSFIIGLYYPKPASRVLLCLKRKYGIISLSGVTNRQGAQSDGAIQNISREKNPLLNRLENVTRQHRRTKVREATVNLPGHDRDTNSADTNTSVLNWLTFRSHKKRKGLSNPPQEIEILETVILGLISENKPLQRMLVSRLKLIGPGDVKQECNLLWPYSNLNPLRGLWVACAATGSGQGASGSLSARKIINSSSSIICVYTRVSIS